MAGPIGGAEPVTLRRLRRGLRRVELASGSDRDSSELLRLILIDEDRAQSKRLMGKLTDVEAAALNRVLSVLRKARVPLERGLGVEEVLWAAWQATGLERRWAAASARGGPIGSQADRDLDAVVALFDAAANYVDRLPRSQLAGFVDYLTSQEIPTDSRSRSVITPDAVTVVSAHAAAGREWAVVAVAGVQEGLWPSLRARGSLLRTEALIDLVNGVSDGSDSAAERLSRTAPLLAEERRLFLVACSRARRRLLITAVESASGDTDLVPSRFVDELIRGDAYSDDPSSDLDVVAPETGDTRVLSLPALVAQLRSVVCDPDIAHFDPEKHSRAARQLARLAAAGVRGAHPDQWYGTAEPSTAAPMWQPEDGPVSLSPSTIELLETCPLRWVFERHGGSDGDNTHAIAGTLVHTLVQALAGRIPPDQVEKALENAWESIDLGSQWYSRRELNRTREMLATFTAWMNATRGELTEVGVEVAVEGVLEPREEGAPAVKLRGRIDRLERDTEGRPVVVDVKTARNPVSNETAQSHAQLAAYQVAAAEGAIAGEPATQPGGARLVFVAKSNKKDGAAQRVQPPLTAEAVEMWRDVIHNAAAATQGPQYLARVNDGLAAATQKARRPKIDPVDLAVALGQHPPTPEQAAVIAAPLGPTLVVAGAGAGKTETMAARVVWLVANGFVDPEAVLGLTFTRKAAQQLTSRIRKRLARLAGSDVLRALDPTGGVRSRILAGEPEVSTYHAYAGRLLSEHGLLLPIEPSATLLSETELWQVAHRVVSGWDSDLDTDKNPGSITETVLALAGQLAEHLVDPEQLLEAHTELD
eukprot:gene23849-28598_t